MTLHAVFALTAIAAACTNKQRASDGDTGVAASATVRDMSATPRAPDSTTAVPTPTSQPAVAVDTAGSKPKVMAKAKR